MNIDTIPKFIINLERRKDRLDKISQEMKYIGWEFEVFKAIDKNDHTGCSLSHSEIIKISKELGYKEVMIIEDDCTIMPYSKDLQNKLNNQCSELDYHIFNLSPTLNRPVNKSDKYDLLIDITNLPKMEEHHRGIFATNIIIYHENSYDKVLDITLPKNLGLIAIDDFIYQTVYLKHQSYAPVLPFAPQTKDWSDVSHGEYSNFFTQTYNWNLYSPTKIPSEFLSFENNQIEKLKNIHKKFYYES
jgi:hypothetical protein